MEDVEIGGFIYMQGNYSNLTTYFCSTRDLLGGLDSHGGR